MAQPGQVFELVGEVQQYAWGKIGMDSEVARLFKAANPEFHVADDEPYAELWMGAHPKAPSRITGMNNQSLLEYVQKNPGVLGAKVSKRFKGELPFLFKVLSVNKSLSIQAHPNKSHAEKLHSERPDIYKDPNHKPEMAIALTPFEGLCGFRPLSEIQRFLQTVPEFGNVVGKEAAEKLIQCHPGSAEVSAALRACFENVMTCKADVREKNLTKLIGRVSEMDAAKKDYANIQGELLTRLNSQFPGDVGCFVIYFLNHITLQPGEAMFLGANEPHAYLDGNCIECMACSDNVVRAGLTPKLIDVPTLCGMLHYTPATPESKKFAAYSADGDSFVQVYNPPVDDFAVQQISVPAGTVEYNLAAADSASILLVIEGGGYAADIKLGPGTVLFLAAGAALPVTLSNSDSLLAFRALCML